MGVGPESQVEACESLKCLIALATDVLCCTGNKAFMKVYQWFYWTSNPQFWEKSQSVHWPQSRALVLPCKISLEALSTWTLNPSSPFSVWHPTFIRTTPIHSKYEVGFRFKNICVKNNAVHVAYLLLFWKLVFTYTMKNNNVKKQILDHFREVPSPYQLNLVSYHNFTFISNIFWNKSSVDWSNSSNF